MNAKDCDEGTLIHLAASGGGVRLKSPLRCEPNVYLKDHDGNTALHFAVLSEDYASIKALVHDKISIEPQNKQSLTGLHLPCLRRVYRHCGTVDGWTTQTPIPSGESIFRV